MMQDERGDIDLNNERTDFPMEDPVNLTDSNFSTDADGTFSTAQNLESSRMTDEVRDGEVVPVSNSEENSGFVNKK